MSPEMQAILAAVGRAMAYAASTPEGKKLLRDMKDAIIANTPGVLGTAARGLALLVPHDVKSVGFKKDGPG